MQKNDKNQRHMIMRSLALLTQVGISMMVPVFLMVAIGIFLDGAFHIHSTLWLMIIGFLAGGRNTYHLVMDMIKKEEKRDVYGENEKSHDGGSDCG